MTMEPSEYRHDLGNGSSLVAHSLDPGISAEDLADMLSTRDRHQEVDLEALADDMPVVARLDSLDELRVDVSHEVYRVPKQLQPFRDALDEKLRREGKFNGGVMAIEGNVHVPLKVLKAGFFDFKATQLSAVPAELLPDQYSANKTVRELLPEYGLNVSQMARYFAFAFVVTPSDGKEIGFVQRAKGLGIAPDCMALSGCTPPFNEDVFREGFDFNEYFRGVIKREMEEEYRLHPYEFAIGKSYFIDDMETTPFVAIEIRTYLSTKDIARRAHRDKEIIKEHPILYSVKPHEVDTLINRFPLLQSSAYVMHLFAEEKSL